MSTETEKPTIRRYVAADGGPTALWVEQSGGGYGTHRRVEAFKEDLDRIHAILWPTLLAQYVLTDSGLPDELDDDGPEGIEWQDAGSDDR